VPLAGVDDDFIGLELRLASETLVRRGVTVMASLVDVVTSAALLESVVASLPVPAPLTVPDTDISPGPARNDVSDGRDATRASLEVRRL
jgi:hypothetical protein